VNARIEATLDGPEPSIHATRAAFRKRRTPGMRRALCGVSVDTDRPLAVSPVYERLTF